MIFFVFICLHPCVCAYMYTKSYHTCLLTSLFSMAVLKISHIFKILSRRFRKPSSSNSEIYFHYQKILHCVHTKSRTHFVKLHTFPQYCVLIWSSASIHPRDIMLQLCHKPQVITFLLIFILCCESHSMPSQRLYWFHLCHFWSLKM